jgi:peroxiredoxin
MAGQPATVDVGTIGPQAGQEVPAFDLIDQGGTRHTRESILGPNGAMLVFFRSADW